MEISSKQLGAFVCGMLFTGLCYFALFVFYFLATFSLSGETLTEKENDDTYLFFALAFIVGFTVLIMWRRIKRRQPFTAIGIAIPLLPALYALIIAGITCFNNLDYHRSFNKHIWDGTVLKPFKMAKTLVKENELLGLSRSQLFDMLGTRDSNYWNNKDHMLYPTDNSWDLEIRFKNDRVEKAYLYQGGFDD